jgi:hypothetical protein
MEQETKIQLPPLKRKLKRVKQERVPNGLTLYDLKRLQDFDLIIG